jgi:hypothetical protein
MHSAVRIYEMTQDWGDTLRTHLTDRFLPALERLPGFVSYQAIEADRRLFLFGHGVRSSDWDRGLQPVGRGVHSAKLGRPIPNLARGHRGRGQGLERPTGDASGLSVAVPRRPDRQATAHWRAVHGPKVPPDSTASTSQVLWSVWPAIPDLSGRLDILKVR